MNSLMKTTVQMCCAGMLAFAWSGLLETAKANHIDYISDGSFFVNHGGGATSTDIQVGNTGNIRGGEREVKVSILSGAGFVSAGTMDAVAGAAPNAIPNDGTLLLSNSARVKGRFELVYDGVGSAGLGGQNFSSTFDSIAVDFADVQGAGDLTLNVRDSSNQSGSVTMPVSNSGVVTFPFSAGGFAGVSFASVQSVQLILDSTQFASDFAINSVTLAGVPEPSTAILLLAMLLATPLVKGRRRSA